MANELVVLQLLTFSTLFFFLTSINIYTLWYLGGFYLVLVGFYALFDDADIIAGFLWVIDLGVGLVLFVFVMHFSNFSHQKSTVNMSDRYFFLINFFLFFLLIFYFFFVSPTGKVINSFLKKSWFFLISWYNYYSSTGSHQISELNLFREIFFFWVGFPFYLINHLVVYGLATAMLSSFLLKKIFVFAETAQFKNLDILNEVGTAFFIRNQNFVKQQGTAANTKVWVKQKYFLTDF